MRIILPSISLLLPPSSLSPASCLPLPFIGSVPHARHRVRHQGTRRCPRHHPSPTTETHLPTQGTRRQLQCSGRVKPLTQSWGSQERLLRICSRGVGRSQEGPVIQVGSYPESRKVKLMRGGTPSTARVMSMVERVRGNRSRCRGIPSVCSLMA